MTVPFGVHSGFLPLLGFGPKVCSGSKCPSMKLCSGKMGPPMASVDLFLHAEQPEVMSEPITVMSPPIASGEPHLAAEGVSEPHHTGVVSHTLQPKVGYGFD